MNQITETNVVAANEEVTTQLDNVVIDEVVDTQPEEVALTATNEEVAEQVQEIVMSLNSARTLPSTTKSAAVRIMIAEAKVNGEEQPAVVARVVTELGFKTSLAKVYVRNNWAKVNAELRTA